VGLGGRKPPLQNLSAVIADRLDRAAFHRFLAKGFFLRAFRLLIDVGMAAVIVALEIGGGSLAAQIAVDALLIDIELSGYVFGVFVCGVGHIFPAKKRSGRLERNAVYAMDICFGALGRDREANEGRRVD
jgi:hypothetical protein